MSSEELKECLAVACLIEEEKYEEAGSAMYFMSETQRCMALGICFFTCWI